MLDDDVRIRAAAPEEAEALSELAWRSEGYWGYSLDMMKEFRDFLTLTHAFIENNPSYVAEAGSSGEVIGFYSLEQKSGGEWWLRHLWVVPERIGTGVGQHLFLNACEVAETIGTKKLKILSDPHSEAFFLRMGAERSGTELCHCGDSERSLPVLEITLT